MGSTSLEDIIKVKAKESNNAHFWLIDGMSKLLTQKIKRCESSDFHVYGLTWMLVIVSNKAKDFLSFYLHILTDGQCIGSNWEVKCSFKLSVVSQTTVASDICKPFTHCFNENNKSRGCHEFISYEGLKNGYLVNDKAVFCAEITQINLNVTSIPRTVGTAERLKLTEVPRDNSKFTWKITQFSSFDSEHHSSYEFTLGPRRWYLQMYPKGHLEGKGNSLSLFLHASDYVTNGPKEKTLAVYKLRVLDQLKRNHHETYQEHQFNSSSSSWGWRKFLPLEKLHNSSRGLLVNDEIYIGVEFLFVSTTEYL